MFFAKVALEGAETLRIHNPPPLFFEKCSFTPANSFPTILCHCNMLGFNHYLNEMYDGIKFGGGNRACFYQGSPGAPFGIFKELCIASRVLF